MTPILINSPYSTVGTSKIYDKIKIAYTYTIMSHFPVSLDVDGDLDDRVLGVCSELSYTAILVLNSACSHNLNCLRVTRLQKIKK